MSGSLQQEAGAAVPPRVAAPAQAAAGPAADRARVERFAKKATSSLAFRLYTLFKMPLAFLAGLRVRFVDTERCETTVPYGWRSQNPFGSTYFAAHTMAAELATGTLAMLIVRLAPERVGMLIVGLDARFQHQAKSTTTFRCEDGPKLAAAVREAVETGEQVRTEVETVGRLADGTEVARIKFYWSFKTRTPRSKQG